jgi:hypothetical protein
MASQLWKGAPGTLPRLPGSGCTPALWLQIDCTTNTDTGTHLPVRQGHRRKPPPSTLLLCPRGREDNRPISASSTYWDSYSSQGKHSRQMRHDSTIARDLRSRLVTSKHGKQLSIVQIRRAKAQAHLLVRTSGPTDPVPLGWEAHPARPHSGLESSAARSARAPNPPVRRVSFTVRSTSRRSRSRSISGLRNPTRVPSKTAAPPRSCSPGPAASAGPSPSPRSPHHRTPRIGLQDRRQRQPGRLHRRLALWAVHVGPRRLGLEGASNSSCRCSCKNTNSLARRTAVFTASSAGDGSAGGRHTTGRTTLPP